MDKDTIGDTWEYELFLCNDTRPPYVRFHARDHFIELEYHELFDVYPKVLGIPLAVLQEAALLLQAELQQDMADLGSGPS